MLALVRFGMADDDIRLQDVPDPRPGPLEVKIEVRAAGVCGTDIHGHPSVRPPVVLGHELAGTIAELGPGCSARRLGDRVTSETTRSLCGTCRFCREGHPSLCERRAGLASRADGCFARYVVVLESSTHLLPDSVAFEPGALSEPLACAVHAVFHQAALEPAEFALVVGPGPLGLLVARCAVLRGAHVAVAGTSADAARLELARRFGAQSTINVESDDLPAAVRRLTDGYGADCVFECSGAPAAVPPALASLRKRGRYVQAGILHRSLPLDFDDLFFVRELSLIGSHTSNPASWAEAMRLLRDGSVDLRPLITAELPLTDWARAFDLMRSRRAVKVILKP